MATWNSANSMLTQTGVAILNKIKAGVGSITVTRIVAGSSSVATSSLYTQTSVSGVQKEFVISNVNTTDGGSEISIYITNEDFTESYSLRQIGIYVTHPDYTGEQLYHISQCDEAGLDVIPKFVDSVTTLSYGLYLEHGNASTLNVTVTQQGMLLAKVFEKFKLNAQEDKLLTVDAEGNLISSGKHSVSGTNSVTISNAKEHRALNMTVAGKTTQSPPTVTNPTQFLSTKVYDVRSKSAGVNLFNIRSAPLKNTAKFGTITIANDSINVVCGGSAVPYIGYIVPVKVGSKYTISFTSVTNSVVSYTELSAPISEITDAEYGTRIANSPLTYTATKPYLLICSHPSTSTTGLTFGLNKVQVQEGSSSSAYTSYVGDTVVFPTAIELNSYNGYSDTLEWDGSKWWKVQRVGDVVIDGTTNLVSQGVAVHSSTYSRLSFALNKTSTNYIKDILPNTPVATTHGNSVGNESDFYAYYYNSGSDISIMGHFKYSAFGIVSTLTATEKVTAINTWLANQNTAGTPLRLRYVLAEPKVTEIAVTDVLRVFESQTTVSVSNSVQDASINLGYAINTTDPTTMYILKSLARKSDIQTANTFALANLIED